MDGNGCVSECLYDANLARRLWTVEKENESLKEIKTNKQTNRERCVSECLYDAILARRLWTVEKDV